MANTYTLIQAQTLASSATSVTFLSISGSYTDLVLRCSARSNQSSNFDYIQLTYNGSSATNYSYVSILGNTLSTVLTGKGASGTTLRNGYANGANSTANTFGSAEIYITNYASSNAKAGSSFSATENNIANAAYAALISTAATLFNSTSNITSIEISPLNGPNWVPGSSFYLYGIKNS